jgi:endonuclease/exonuclease/phosphatase family metal-dependent hydrolase
MRTVTAPTAQLLAWIAELSADAPAILLGDLNTTPGSRFFRAFEEARNVRLVITGNDRSDADTDGDAFVGEHLHRAKASFRNRRVWFEWI